MRYLKHATMYTTLIGLFIILTGAVASTASAQVRVGVGIGIGPAYVAVGAPPVCPYGYYPSYPYACAPEGYYGPEWFANGVFIGAGPWYHGFHREPVFVGRRFEGPRYVDRDRGFDRGFAGRGRDFDGRGHGDFRGEATVRGGFQGGGSFHGSSRSGGGFHGGGHGGHR